MSQGSEQERSTSYAECLDALGVYLQRANAAHVFIDEIEGGFLLGFSAGEQQRVATIDADELATLLAQAHQRPGMAFSTHLLPALRGRRRDEARNVRARLRAVGDHLDRRHAQAIVVQERESGFSMEYTGIPETDILHELARINETLDV